MPLFRFLTGWRPARFLALAGPLAGLLAFRLLPADDTEVLRHLVLSVQKFYQTARPETPYLHLDKEAYTAGETVWMRAYVVDAGQHQLDTLSKVLHVELISDRQQVVSRRTLALAGGLGAGQLELADTLAPGTYLLRAYTGWMRNASPDFFYTRRVQVWPAGEPEAGPNAATKVAPNAEAKNRAALRRATQQARQTVARVSAPPDVQFFAEGGNLVAGLENVVAFKAVDYTGTSFELMGQVFDSKNQVVATFKSRHGGMGSFKLTPVAGESYHATFSSAPAGALTVALPPVQASGYVLQVVPSAEAFDITIQQRGGKGGPILLLGQMGSTVGYLGRGQVEGKEIFAARIPKSKFASGIVHFTLFDGQGQPLAERLAFAQNEPALRVALTPSQPSYGPHQPVRVLVAVTDAAGRPVATQLSLAVADAGSTNPWADNIAARLLLTADLAGYVENPGYYFDNPTPDTNQHLDDLLLTQGWRRFAWAPVLAGQAPTQDFGVERSIGILGQITRRDGTPSPQSTLSFLQAKPNKVFFSTVTDDQGRFLINGLGGCDTLRATLQARTDKGRRNLTIRLDPGPAAPKVALPPLPAAPAPALVAALKRGQQQQADERRYHLANTVALSNVNVRGQRQVEADTRRIYAPGNATVIDMNNIPSALGSTVLQVLQGRVPGLTVSGVEPNIQVQIRGNTSFSGSSPLILLDGVPVTIDALAFYPATDVERVEILKGGQAAIFGSRGSGGVIAVYTRRGSPTYDHRQDMAPGILSVRLPGYNCPRQFYAPRYGAGAPALTRPDTRRTTLYWNPTVHTDASGQAQLTFYTSDALGTFQLRAEGLAASGQPALGMGTLEVK
ncbi:TonB-dependent receptor plug domain-containing protein [Hymenobacter sp. HMF4947]|uniref:TonB-dependent receptor plug domain-containing protein n=1 Tax=Hymenobacter ginkgonis TaxID=2682976 RepID=A0A7K1TC30_9BACT|nr:TonB-dependent receptor plug domain-containing protein [Hymenobacter ginkgonis]MVN75966.1 TonB-dependent receptor plug domain-containing protein [Hymenobacter ginkgonis]